MLQRAEKERSHFSPRESAAGWSRNRPSSGRVRSEFSSSRDTRPPRGDERRERASSREHHSSRHAHRKHDDRDESERSAQRESHGASRGDSRSSRNRRSDRSASASSSSGSDSDVARSRPTYRTPAGPSKPPTSHAYTPQFPLPTNTDIQIARTQQRPNSVPTTTVPSAQSTSNSVKEAPPAAANNQPSSVTEVPKAPATLSAEELNKLAARVLRAELAGNATLAKQLQTQLEAARRASANSPDELMASRASASGEKRADSTPEVVLLTTRDTHGFEQPLRSATPAAANAKAAADASRNEAMSTRAERFQTLQRELRGELRELAEAERKRTANDVDLQFAKMVLLYR